MTQLTEAEVHALYAQKRYDEIEKARAEGRLNVLLGAPAPVDISPGRRLTSDDLSRLYAERRYDDINSLRREGRFDHLLTGVPEPDDVPATAPPAQHVGYLTPADINTKD